MHYLFFIVCVVLIGKDNYLEWLRRIKHTFIFNNLWDGICEGDNGGEPTEPTTNEYIAMCKGEDKKSYAFIVATISEEVSHHIMSITYSYYVLIN